MASALDLLNTARGSLSKLSAPSSIRPGGSLPSNRGVELVSGGGLSVQGGGSIPQGTGNSLVPSFGTSGGPQVAASRTSVPSGGSGGGGGGGISAEEQARLAREAEEARVRTQRKNSVTNLVKSIQGVYDALYGDINTAAADSTRLVNERFATENEGLADQFQSQFRDIGNAFSARGAYDSSYRGDAERTAQKGYENLLAAQGTKQRSELADIGKYVSSARAEVQGDREALNLIMQQLPDTNNLDELQQLVNQLQARKGQAGRQRAGTGTQNFYLKQLGAIDKKASNVAQLRGQLSNILSAEVPSAVKGNIVSNLINGAQLTAQEKEQLMQEYGALITSEEEQPVAA